MRRKLRSMFRSVVPRPGNGEKPAVAATGMTGGAIGQPGPGAVSVVMGPVAGPGGVVGGQPVVTESKGGPTQDEVAKLAYERWLQTGGSSTENWAWAESRLRERYSAEVGRGEKPSA